MKTEQTFDNWFDIFTDECRKLGYDGVIDKDSFEFDFLFGKAPEISAADFVNEINNS